MTTARIAILLAIAFAWPVCAVAQEPVDYLTAIKPLLETKCYACHGVLKQEAKLRLDTRTLMATGGDSGPALVPGDADASLILQRIADEHDSRMPPPEEGAALKSDEIALLRRWIGQGAIAPAEVALDSPTKHWAFQKIERPTVAVPDGANPIDVLLDAKRTAAGVGVQSPAERSLLIRRLYLDVIGLPPTLEQLRDKRPWLEIVDELLTSPQHGERWGRHWMDVWRYSDWYGLGAQLRHSQKHMWHWRDWIVNSLNADKGYNRMIQEMLAGDELAPNDTEAVTGTGFLARNYYLFNRTTWLDSTIEHTGKAFLGLTLNCAKCHDHKYDPITHVDYYSMRAIFEPHQVRLDPVPGETNFEKDGLPRVFDDQPDAKTFLHLRGDPKNPDKGTHISPRVPALFTQFQPPIKSVALPAQAYAPATRGYVERDYLKRAQAAIDTAQKGLNKACDVAGSVSTTKPEPAQPTKFVFEDDFDKPNPKAWKIVGDDWIYAEGTVKRETSTRAAERLQLRQQLPRDFEATCHYTHTGGATYKSVTFRFDESADQKYANFVYTSAHAPGPKVQIATTRNGNSDYPPTGRVGRPIEIGKAYELKFAVRERLVNVRLDGDFVIAYELPDRRAGTLSLSGFDGTVAFDWIRVRTLPPDVKLVAPKNSSPSTVDPKTALAAAELKLIAAQKQLASLQAVIKADKAKLSDNPHARKLATEAARIQAESLLAEAAHEQLVAGDDGKKTKAAAAKRKTANAQLEDARAGKPHYKSLRASRKALEGPDHKEANYPPTYSRTSTGRRLALAKWVTSRDNPLTARVAVNHVWMRHFGEPLVESVFDFGLRAKEPVQRELLDWLAVEFIESGWSFKRLHQLILTSNAYRLSSSLPPTNSKNQAADPNNTLYWRANTRRMESQVVRDSLLQLAGTLDLTLGGPSLNANSDSKRRSLYFKHSRDAQDKFLTMFDDADLLQCYRRSESIVPQQALALANSKVSMQMAKTIAAKLSKATSSADDAEFIGLAVETLLGRKPRSGEVSTCLDFCSELRALLNESTDTATIDDRVRTRLIHSLLNHNDFIVIR